VLHVGLDDGVGEATTNEALGVEDSVLRVEVTLVLGGTTNEALYKEERKISEN